MTNVRISMMHCLIAACVCAGGGCGRHGNVSGANTDAAGSATPLPPSDNANSPAIVNGGGAAVASHQTPPPLQGQKLATQFGGRMEMQSTGRAEWHLDLAHSQITDADLAIWELPSEVVSVNLSHTAITDKGLENLKTRAPHLGRLDLMGTKITDQGLQHLKSMPSLWSVSVEGTSISVDGHLNLMQFLAPRLEAYLARQNVPQP